MLSRPNHLTLPQKLILHLGCWTLLIFSELSFLRAVGAPLESFTVYATYYVINALFFYGLIALTTHFFTRHPRPYLKAVLLYLIIWLLYFGVKQIAEILLHQGPAINYKASGYWLKFLTIQFHRGLFCNILVAFYSMARLTGEYQQQAVTTQNTLRQAQMNPHLLFNMLNRIYTNFHQVSEEGARAVWLLSEIMRYGTEASQHDEPVYLRDEITQVRNLLEMHRLRFDGQLAIEVEMAGDFHDAKIIPLVLLTLTENMLKHGDLQHPDNRAILRIEFDENRVLTYYSRNRIKTSVRGRKSTGLGLVNLRQRLQFAYDDRFSLVDRRERDEFEISLKLQL
ncbi:sensor histidine kinase [Mucilaginibacter agri]|nr:histidine kinase [Mucilaginibacter agri]